MNYVMLRSALVSAFIAFGTAVSGADSDVCSVVLQSHAFDIHQSTTRISLATATAEDICKTAWSSEEEAKATVRKWDSNASAYEGMFKGTGNGQWDDSKHTIKENFDWLCASDHRSSLTQYFMTTFDHVADVAVNAWLQCVLNTNQKGLFSKLTIAPDRSSFTIDVVYKPNGAGDVLHIDGYTSDQGYTCKYLDEDARDFDVTEPDVLLTCNPTREGDVTAAINTSSGAIGPYHVPSKQFLDLSRRYDELLARVASLAETASALKASLDSDTSRIDALERAPTVKIGDNVVLGYANGAKFLSGDSGSNTEKQVFIGGTQTKWKVMK